LTAFVSWGRFEIYGVEDNLLNLSGFIIFACILIFCIFYKKSVLEKYPKSTAFYNFGYIGIVMRSFSSVSSILFRIGLYYYVFFLVLLPQAAVCEKDPVMKKNVYLVIIILFIAYMYYSGLRNNYLFFWDKLF
jgi:hypothetical protein